MLCSRRRLLSAAVAPPLAMAGCANSGGRPSTPETPPDLPENPAFGYTHLTPAGNRRLSGSGPVNAARPVELPVRGTPAWLLAFPAKSGSYWTVVKRQGTATTYRVDEETVERTREHGTVSSPPIGYEADDRIRLIDPPSDIGDYTHPVPLSDGLLYVASNGDAVIWKRDSRTRLDIDAPSDVRPIALGRNRFLIYGAQTDRYRHGALGDIIEPSGLYVIDVAEERISAEVPLEDSLVFEGLAPILADLTGDGTVEVITTIADATDGARVRVYDTTGTIVDTGPIYGPGWRHQLSVAPFGADGRSELAVVRKPHVDRVVEFYRLEAETLSITTTLGGFASHTYGSRNLDGGVAGDLDGDGQSELLVPTTERRELAAVRRTRDGARNPWSLSLGGQLETNVTGVTLDDGRLSVGAGTADGVRVWQA